jgi:hypothetical protein
VADGAVAQVLQAAAAAGVPAQVIGRTGGADIRIDVDGRTAVRQPVAEAEAAWATVIERRMQTAAGAA